jgi:small subunit ribosomal protein S3
MGQKVSPVGMRVGINRDWHSRWFASNQEYAKFLHEDIRVRAYLEKELKEALLSHVEIERHKTDKGHDVTVQVFVARPGVVIGQEGANINRIKKEVGKLLKGSNVRLDVVDVKNPDLDAALVAQWIATELENRASFRTAQKKAIQRIRKAGAKGCKTMVSGRLGGADIARSEGYKEGIVPLTTLRSDIDFAIKEAVTPYGRLGVKVWICKPAEGERKEHEQHEARRPRGERPEHRAVKGDK